MAKKPKTVTIKRRKKATEKSTKKPPPQKAGKPQQNDGSPEPDSPYIYVRDNSGQFAPGTSGGPGRMTRQMEKELVDVFQQVISPDRFREVLQILLAQAMTGNILAITKILEYAIGRPKQQRVMEAQSSIRHAGMTPAEFKGKMADRIMSLLMVARTDIANSEADSKQQEMITVRK